MCARVDTRRRRVRRVCTRRTWTRSKSTTIEEKRAAFTLHSLGEREKRISSHTNETMRAERSRPARAFPKGRASVGERDGGRQEETEEERLEYGWSLGNDQGEKNVEIVTHRRCDSPSLDKVNKNVPTRTSRGTCEAITGGPGRIFSIVFPFLLLLHFHVASLSAACHRHFHQR